MRREGSQTPNESLRDTGLCKVALNLWFWHPERGAHPCAHVTWDDQTEGSAGAHITAWERRLQLQCLDFSFSGQWWLFYNITLYFQYRQGPSVNLPCVVNCPICKSFNQELFSYLTFFSPVVLWGPQVVWQCSVLHILHLLLRSLSPYSALGPKRLTSKACLTEPLVLWLLGSYRIDERQ